MGIQILNKDVSIISNVMGKPKANVGNIFGKTGWVGGVSAPFIITAPTLSESYTCGYPGNQVTINNMIWGGSPTPTITYRWLQADGGESGDIEIGQYTNTLYLDYSMREFSFFCEIIAQNSEGLVVIYTENVYVYDCS